MLESFKSNDAFKYTKLTEEECKSRGILGRLKGIIADSKSATRNGRLYSKELWEKVFENPIMKEKIANRVCYGELCHPEDRTETDMEKIAVCLAEQPKISDDGKIYGVFDILDTPNGRILKTLCDYGTTIGVSSRGTGDLITDEDGNESVDPNTYNCECWDVVLIPAVESARLQYVNESLDAKDYNLKKALNESLDKSTPNDRRVMEETLNKLGINTSDSENIDSKETSKQLENSSKEAIDDGANEIIKSLQEAIKDKTKLEEEKKSLQEKLAVSNTKVDELKEELDRYKSTTLRLSSIAHESKELSNKVSTLEEKLEKRNSLIENLRKRNSSLVEERKVRVEKSKTNLNESINKKDIEIKSLNESISIYENRMKELNEELDNEKQNTTKKLSALNEQLTKSNRLMKSYKTLANNIVDKYIETKATMLGITKNEIKNKLEESYTLDDIDNICKELQTQALNISKLPYDLRKGKVVVNESKKDRLQDFTSMRKDIGEDEVDDNLVNLANLFTQN